MIIINKYESIFIYKQYLNHKHLHICVHFISCHVTSFTVLLCVTTSLCYYISFILSYTHISLNDSSSLSNNV